MGLPLLLRTPAPEPVIRGYLGLQSEDGVAQLFCRVGMLLFNVSTVWGWWPCLVVLLKTPENMKEVLTGISVQFSYAPESEWELLILAGCIIHTCMQAFLHRPMLLTLFCLCLFPREHRTVKEAGMTPCAMWTSPMAASQTHKHIQEKPVGLHWTFDF